MRLGAGIPLFQPSPARPVWTHPKAVWACDFVNARHALDGRMRDLSALVTVTRSSSHLLTDADGVVRSFGPNALASTIDVGAYVGGQRLNMLLASCAFTTPLLWTKYGSPAIADNAALAPDGAITGASFSGAAGGAYLLTQNLNVMAGQKYTLAVWMRGAAGGEKIRIDFKNQTSGGVSGTLFTLTSGWKRYSVTLTADATAQRGFQLRVESGFGNPDFTFFMWNAVVEAGSFASPDIVSPVDAQGVRLASDVRAIASGSEPFAGFAAAGLADGFTVLAVVNLTHLGDGVSRGIWSFGPNTTTARVYGTINAVDGVQFAVQKDVTTLLAKYTANGFLATGRKRVGITIKSGAFYIAATGLTSVSDATALSLPVPTDFTLGNVSQAVSYFNDTIEQLQVCRPLTQAEVDAWVAA